MPPGISAPSAIPLSGPPPNPVNSPAMPSGTPQFGGVPGTPQAPPAEDTAAKFLAAAGLEIDKMLKAMAKAVPLAGPEFGQANQLIQAGIAKYLAQGPGAVATSPTATGPGGSF